MGTSNKEEPTDNMKEQSVNDVTNSNTFVITHYMVLLILASWSHEIISIFLGT